MFISVGYTHTLEPPCKGEGSLFSNILLPNVVRKTRENLGVCVCCVEGGWLGNPLFKREVLTWKMFRFTYAIK